VDAPVTHDDEPAEQEALTRAGRDAPLRSAAVYALSSALPRGIGFVLLPLYTRSLNPAQYGTISLLLSAGAGVGILFTLGLDIAIFRTYFELASDPKRQIRFVDSIWRFLVVFPVGAALVLGGVLWPILGNGGRFSGLDVLLALVATSLSVGATTLPLAVLRAEQRLRHYIAITGVTTLATAGFTVLFVVVLDAGVTGWLVATLVANTATLIAAGVLMPWKRSVEFDGRLVRRSVLLGLPLVPHFLSHWALQLADRSVLAGLVSPESLGVYSLAANFGLPVMLLVQSLNQGFMPTYARTGTSGEGQDHLSRVVVLQAALVTTICTAAALIAPPVIGFVAPPTYSGAGPLVAWIVLGYGFLGLYYIPMNGVSLGAGRTKLVWVATALSAVTNIALLVALVPGGGLRAAAIASAVGYAVLLVTIFIYSNVPGNPVRYRWRTLLTIFVGAACFFVLVRLTTPERGAEALLLRLSWLAAAAVAVTFLRRAIIRREHVGRRLPFD
jgi:O-antigen/teichoic acid export membrane protein